MLKRFLLNNRLVECQSKILSTAINKDKLTFHEGGEKFIDNILMLTEKYKDELGEYKILYVKAIPALLDALKTKFNWKRSVEVLLED